MSKIGVSLSIDVTAIIKDHINNHQNGKKYLDMTVFIDPSTEDKFGNNGMIVQNWKDAPKGGTPILGNAKVFWREPNDQQPPAQAKPANNTLDSFDDDCPFS
jgi:hypothetical protein